MMCPLTSSAFTISTARPKGTHRGGHAHKALRQVLWCPYGSIRIRLDNGREGRRPAGQPRQGPDRRELYVARDDLGEKRTPCSASRRIPTTMNRIISVTTMNFWKLSRERIWTDAVDGTPLTPADEAEWDRFVMHESSNSTFLQTRNFLNYHPRAGLRMPRSWSITSTAASAQWCPRHCGWTVQREFSALPPGSTFGGPVLRSTYNSAAKSIGILQAVEDYIATRYDAADFRPTPDLFNGVENVALQCAFTYLGYTQQTELSTGAGGGPHAGNTAGVLPPEQKAGCEKGAQAGFNVPQAGNTGGD